MSSIVLDASALLALLLGEPGGDRVRAVLGDSTMATPNLAEIVAYYARNGVKEREGRQILGLLPIEWAPFSEELAYDAGLMYPITRAAGLSPGDRACLALARQRRLPAMTADRGWSAIAKVADVQIEFIRS
jgi:ribonuclease VapC